MSLHSIDHSHDAPRRRGKGPARGKARARGGPEVGRVRGAEEARGEG